MSTRVTVLVGLLAGAVTAAVVLAAIVALGPDPAAGLAPSPLVPSGSAQIPPSPRGSAPSAAPSVAASAAVPSAGPSVTGFHVGEPAPALVVTQVGGGTIDLGNLAGKPVWVNFMATYCPPCVDEFPQMNGFAARYAGEGLVVIAVDVAEDEGTVAAFAERLGATFPIGLDPDGHAQDAWDAAALPIHFWVDAEGIVRYGATGGIGPDVMADGLRAIMPGVEIES